MDFGYTSGTPMSSGASIISMRSECSSYLKYYVPVSLKRGIYLLHKFMFHSTPSLPISRNLATWPQGFSSTQDKKILWKRHIHTETPRSWWKPIKRRNIQWTHKAVALYHAKCHVPNQTPSPEGSQTQSKICLAKGLQALHQNSQTLRFQCLVLFLIFKKIPKMWFDHRNQCSKRKPAYGQLASFSSIGNTCYISHEVGWTCCMMPVLLESVGTMFLLSSPSSV